MKANRKVNKVNRKATTLLEFVLGLVIGLAILLLLIFVVIPAVWNIFFGKQEEMQAKGILQKFSNLVKDAETKQNVFDFFQKLEDWSIVYMPENVKAIGKFKKPEEYWARKIVCVCKKKECKYCKIVDKDILDKENNYMKLKLDKFYNLQLTARPDAIIYSINPTIEFAPLSKSKAKSTRELLEAKNETLNLILKIANNKSIYPPTLLAAIAVEESKLEEKAVSPCGAAGIMQLVPATAMQHGLKVAVNYFGSNTFTNYEAYKSFLTSKNLWNIGCCGSKQVSPCNFCTLQYCDFANDERFNAEKSITAAAEYLKGLINDFKNAKYIEGCYKDGILQCDPIDYAIAAYHDGKEGLDEKCFNKAMGVYKPSLLCFEFTQGYVSRVKTYKQEIESYIASITPVA
jgi:hypothetical protein